MPVFATGATGWVGSATIDHLIAAGHDVLGLARSPDAAARPHGMGVEVIRGDLAQTEGLARAAQSADAVIHTGFIHDFADFARSCAIDRAAIEAMGAALEGTGNPFLVTGGMVGHRSGPC